MTENRTIQLVEIPVGGKGGLIWRRLHEEREEICETLAGISGCNSDINRELLQARLRKIDDALDRLMSGSYGACSDCGQPINKIKLDTDPATSRCLDCSGRKPESIVPSSVTSKAGDFLLENLNPFDTILLRTHNSDYRILLLDPNTGRAVIEGGRYLPEPSEGLIMGSALPGSDFNIGGLCIGARLELWVNEQVFLTSPIQSVEVKHSSVAESVETISAAVH
jgi:DksA/TraR C4-type zinc finger protein